MGWIHSIIITDESSEVTMTDVTVEKNLPPIRGDILEKFQALRPAIIQEAARRSLQFEDEVSQHGEKAESILKIGLTFTVQAIEAAMRTGNTGIIDYQIPWGLDRLTVDKVQPQHVLHRFQILKQVINASMQAETAARINPYIDQLIQKQKEGMKNA